MDEDIQNWPSASSTTIPFAFGEKSLVNFGPLITEILMWNHTHPNWLSGDHILGSRGCCTLNFSHMLENNQVLLAHTPLGMGVPLTIFFKVRSQIA